MEPDSTDTTVGAEQPHPRHVERLPRGVDGAHVDDTLQAQQRARRRGRHPVLASTGLGDHPRLAHLPRQQRLTQHVVDLVRSGVVEVFSLQEDPRATRVLAKAASASYNGDGRPL